MAVALALGLGSWLLAAGRPAVGEPAQPAERVGDETCVQCHAQYVPAWNSVRHNRYVKSDKMPEGVRGCEGCHGPGSAHVQDENFHSIRNAKTMSGLPAAAPCLQCHSGKVKPASWLATPHAQAGLSCGSCHAVHQEPGGPSLLKQPTTELCLSCHPAQAAEFRMNSHHPVLEGRMECIDCHNPHADGPGTKGILKAGDDRCVKCHLEKRGPFTFEHQTTTDDGDGTCQSCHKPHGSPSPKLQTYFGRGICLQCHADIASAPAHLPRVGNCFTAGCHRQFHGSNTDRLFFN